MATKRAAVPARHLFSGFRLYEQPVRSFARSMATINTPSLEAAPTQEPLTPPNVTIAQTYENAQLQFAPTEPILQDNFSINTLSGLPTSTRPQVLSRNRDYTPPPNPFRQNVTCTLYSFPSLEPISTAEYPDTHLLLPLRKDILHRAVIFEADISRQGTASTKWRSEIHGSNKKVRPQKGTGSARLGDKKSPMLRGGGVAFGPKPRDFSTELPRKVYDLAWRTALSFRYRKGQLIVTDGKIDIPGVHENSLERYMQDVLQWNGWGKPNGKTLFVTNARRHGLFTALESRGMDMYGKVREVDFVDVKNLLEGERVVVERDALNQLLLHHESDLALHQRLRSSK